ncbi:response regulator receiver protein [Desulfovibrio sp. X2]|uniref:response regulator n=1 Tax=Desulfovibrio sp. X2 TaxID=941449 RepID=UPI0003589AFF|nr:response regulator [Desulfovibrio sp. X2]EPR37458.1 response regulator receiver protein [Desulfovibrio sp. X2]
MLQGKNILIADSDSANAVISRILVERWGARARCVATGQEALELALTGNFDLLVTEMLLAGLSGADLIRAIREEPDPVGCMAILVLHAGPVPPGERCLLEVEADDCLPKPFDFQAFGAKASAALDRAALRCDDEEGNSRLRANGWQGE